MSQLSVNLEGVYELKLTDDLGKQTHFQQQNIILRNGLKYLIEGTCVRNLFLGRGTALPTVDESYKMTSLIDVTTQDYIVELLEDNDGVPYYQHQWKFLIPPGEILTDVTELATGYMVLNGEIKDRRYFSRTILRDIHDKPTKFTKRAIDTLEITYTLKVQFEGIANTAQSQPVGVKEVTSAIGQHSQLDLATIALNQPMVEGKFFHGYAYTEEPVFQPFAFVDDHIVSIALSEITSVSVGTNQSVSALIRIEEPETAIGRLAIYSRLGTLQYRFTPRIEIFTGGYIELKINFILGNK